MRNREVGAWVKGMVEQGDRAGGTGKVRQIYMGHRGGTWWHGGTGGTGKVGRADFGRHVGQSRRDREGMEGGTM